MADDDLRFGDVDGNGGSSVGGGIIDLLIQAIVALVVLYVLLKIVEILFNIPIPLI